MRAARSTGKPYAPVLIDGNARRPPPDPSVLAPFGLAQRIMLRNLALFGNHTLPIAVGGDTASVRGNTVSGICHSPIFEDLLNLPVFTKRSVDGDESEIDIVRQFEVFVANVNIHYFDADRAEGF